MKQLLKQTVSLCWCWDSLLSKALYLHLISQEIILWTILSIQWKQYNHRKVSQVPTGERLTFGDKEFMKFEEAGAKNACRAAFVLVAGGLGERLGYSGIKVNTTISCCS
jgi:UDP-N-acetylglucosamine pyrophosphorylase